MKKSSFFSNVIESNKDIEKALKVKVLVNIPVEKRKTLVSNSTLSKKVTKEAFKVLRNNLQFLRTNLVGDNKTILLTSDYKIKGKSYISSNMAISFAKIGKRVVLVDSDMSYKKQFKKINEKNGLGLSNFISGLSSNGLEKDIKYPSIIRKTKINNLYLITPGTIPPNSSQLLQSERFSILLKKLKRDFDLIIFDGAPLFTNKDTSIIAKNIANTILIAEYDVTKKDSLVKAKKEVETAGSRVIGAILHQIPIYLDKIDARFYFDNDEEYVKKYTFKESLSDFAKGTRISYYKYRLKKQEKKEQEILNKQNELKELEELERQEKQKQERLRKEQERVELERLEEERLEKERLEQEQLEQERLEQERLNQARIKQMQLEREREEQEQLELEKKAREEIEKIERERIEREEVQKAEQERIEKEEAERLEQERIDAEAKEILKRHEESLKEQQVQEDKKVFNYFNFNPESVNQEKRAVHEVPDLDPQIQKIIEEKRMMEEAERKAQAHFDEIERKKQIKQINIEFKPEFLTENAPEIKLRKFDDFQREAKEKGIKPFPSFTNTKEQVKENDDSLDDDLSSKKAFSTTKTALKKFGDLVKLNYEEYENKQSIKREENQKKQEEKRKLQEKKQKELEQKRLAEEAEKKAQEKFDLLEKQKQEEKQKRDMELIKKAQDELKQMVNKEKKKIEEEQEKKRIENLTPEEEYEEVSKDLYQMYVSKQLENDIEENENNEEGKN